MERVLSWVHRNSYVNLLDHMLINWINYYKNVCNWLLNVFRQNLLINIPIWPCIQVFHRPLNQLNVYSLAYKAKIHFIGMGKLYILADLYIECNGNGIIPCDLDTTESHCIEIMSLRCSWHLAKYQQLETKNLPSQLTMEQFYSLCLFSLSRGVPARRNKFMLKSGTKTSNKSSNPRGGC